MQCLEQRRLLSITPLALDDDTPERETVGSQPTHLFAAGDTLYFSAHDGIHGQELWKSDGTAAGTVMVKDLRPGEVSSLPRGFALFNDAVYFIAESETNQQLWKTDGAAAGTTLVADLASPAVGTPVGNETPLVVANGALFLITSNALYKSDGTTNGTAVLKQFPQSTFVERDPIVSGNKVYFLVDDPAQDRQLWVSDGTANGTVLIKDLTHDDANFFPPQRAAFNGELYFAARTPAEGVELWKTNGTQAGTVAVTDFELEDSQIDGLKVIDNSLYFAALDSGGARLWKIKASAPTTATSITQGFNNIYPFLAGASGTVYFPAAGQLTNRELWKTDGTPAGTVMVKDITPGTSGTSLLQELSMFDGDVYFAANTEELGWELWKSDGTAAGTNLLKNIAPGRESSFNSLDTWRVVIGDTMFFIASDIVHGQELWKTDGTEAGTVMVADINAQDPPLFHGNLTEGFILFARGTVGDDTITFSISGDQLVGTRNGVSESRKLTEFGKLIVSAQHGNDTIDASALPELPNPQLTSFRLIIEGGPGNDTITGGAGHDALLGEGGNDVIFGNAGKDRIYGGDGNDLLSGNSQKDTVDGGLGADRVAGNGGNDRLYGGGGNDRIFGGASRDYLYGNGGNDQLFGEAGNDHLNGGGGSDTLCGGDGDDSLISRGDNAIDRLFGDDGDDLAIADEDDVLTSV